MSAIEGADMSLISERWAMTSAFVLCSSTTAEGNDQTYVCTEDLDSEGMTSTSSNCWTTLSSTAPKFRTVNSGTSCNSSYTISGNCHSWLSGPGTTGGRDYATDGGTARERSWAPKLGTVYGECCDLEQVDTELINICCSKIRTLLY